MRIAAILTTTAVGLLIYGAYLEATDPRPCLRYDIVLIYTGNGTMVPSQVCGERGPAPVLDAG